MVGAGLSCSEPCGSSLQIKMKSLSLCSEEAPELTVRVPGGRAEPCTGPLPQLEGSVQEAVGFLSASPAT